MKTFGIQRSLRNSRLTGYQNSGSIVLFVQILQVVVEVSGHHQRFASLSFVDLDQVKPKLCMFTVSVASLPDNLIKKKFQQEKGMFSE